MSFAVTGCLQTTSLWVRAARKRRWLYVGVDPAALLLEIVSIEGMEAKS